MLSDDCSVVSPSFTGHLVAEGFDVASLMRHVGAQIAFQGSARAAGSRLRVTARIVNSIGAQLWSDRIDVEVDAKYCFAIEERIAEAIAAGWVALRPGLGSRLDEAVAGQTRSDLAALSGKRLTSATPADLRLPK
jgi:hypothetical protein